MQSLLIITYDSLVVCGVFTCRDISLCLFFFLFFSILLNNPKPFMFIFLVFTRFVIAAKQLFYL